MDILQQNYNFKNEKQKKNTDPKKLNQAQQ